MSNILFVYGTLRIGEYNHYLLDGETYMGSAAVSGKLATITGGFPQYKQGEGNVFGELYALSAGRIEELDSLEIPYGYRRITVQWDDEYGRNGECWTYEYIRSIEHATQIPSGDWVEWRKGQNG